MYTYTQFMSDVARNLNLNQIWDNTVHLASQVNANIPENVKEALATS